MSNTHVTPQTRALLEQPTVSQLIMKFQALHEIRIFITVPLKSTPLFSMFSQVFPVRDLRFYFLKIQFNIILSHKPRSSK
jgi:hypothetical protein